ncbi:hypothetical protein PG984_014338 [Apiospora sp. TS-2023a]
MKFLPILLLSVGSTVHGAVVSNITSLNVRDHQPDSQTLAHYEEYGMCMHFYTRKKAKELEPCLKYCQKHGGHGYAECDASRYNDIDLNKPTPFDKGTDDDGDPWVPAPCRCENKAVEGMANLIIDFVAHGLAELDNVLCAVFVSAIREVADIGLMFVPGGAAVRGAGKVIQYAKSGYENGMNAADFYTDWVGKACGVPGWNFSLDDMFMDLVHAPDSLMGTDVSSTGCIHKDKTKCRNLDKKGDPEEGAVIHPGSNGSVTHKRRGPDKRKVKGGKPPNPNSGKPGNGNGGTPSNGNPGKPNGGTPNNGNGGTPSNGSPGKPNGGTPTNGNVGKPTNDNDGNPKSCNVKRAPASYFPPPTRKVGKFGEDEVRMTKECIGGKTQDVVHITRTDSNIGSYIQERKDIPKIVCKAEHSQACYHYRSVMSRYSKTKDMTEWTCQQTATSHKDGWGHDGAATDSWGATAITKLPRIGQHWFPWANGFIYNEERPIQNNKQVTIGCDRDEFPPRYFWPGDGNVPTHNQNRGADQLWGGFCNDYNAASTAKKETYVVSANLKSVKGKENREVTKGVTTSITTVTVSTLRAIFSIAEFPGLKANYDGLDENPCYPKELAGDPGWALLTDDEWYKSEGRQYTTMTASYRKSPTKAQVVKAIEAIRKGPAHRRANLKPMTRLRLDQVVKRFGQGTTTNLWKKYVGDGDGQIPAELWGVLPSLPPFPKPVGIPRRRSLADVDALNQTLTADDHQDRNDNGDHLDGLTDEELNLWLYQYEETAHRTPTSPPVVEADATMTVARGVEEPVRSEPAAIGSEVTGSMPVPTGMWKI